MEKERIPIQIRIPIISDKQNFCPYKEPFGYIYMVTNKVNGHYYIGKHEFHRPWLDESYRGSGYALQSAYKKYGKNNFDTIILEWTDKDDNELNTLERYWIDVFGAYKFSHHYNLTEGGEGVSVEVIRQHMIGENNHRYQTKMTEQEVQKLHDSWRGKKHTDEYVQYMKIKMRGSTNARSRKIALVSDDMEIIEVFSSAGEAERAGYGDSTSIMDCCHRHGTPKYKQKYKFLFLEDCSVKGGEGFDS